MKAFYLSRSLLNLQKCLLPDSEFVQENYGRHCFMSTSNADCEFLVKLGLCEIKTIKGAFYVDGSVYKCSSFRQFSEATLLSNVTFNNFTVLKKPLIAKTVKVIVVFFDVYDIQKFKNCKSDLLKILGNVLKLFTFCDKSVLSLKNFDKNQTFGIKYIIINSVDISNHHQPFEVNSNTEIKVEKCITQLKFQQWQMNKNSNEIECCNIVYQILQEAMQLVKMDSQIIKSAKKILLIGPRGCGKRTIIHSLAYKNDFILLEIAAANINSTEGQIQLRNIFDKAKIYLNNDENCIILIKNIDMISGKGKHSKKVIGELINLIKDVENMVGIIIIATTHSLSDVDMGLRGHKRFEDEIEILVPTADERKDIISQILGSCKINCDKDLISQLSKQTAGFVGSDLKLVITEALLSLQKFQVGLVTENNALLQKCFNLALTKVIPSELRGTVGLCKTNDIAFSQIGGLDNIKKILSLSVKQQLENPSHFEKFGIPLTKGILLYGPPGCAKTTLVKALAKESNTTFLATSAADLYSPYVGDAEKKIVNLFVQARIGSPAIIFIDEIDAVVGSKSGDREQGVQERILSTLLIEMDGIGLKVNMQKDTSLSFLANECCEVEKTYSKDQSDGVIIIGATNHPELLDPALKRPGRFDKLIYIPPPNKMERLQILEKLTEKMPLHESVNLKYLAELTEFYSGADLKNLCQECGLYVLNCTNMSANCIHQFHFEQVISKFKPSLNKELIKFYESFEMSNE